MDAEHGQGCISESREVVALQFSPVEWVFFWFDCGHECVHVHLSMGPTLWNFHHCRRFLLKKMEPCIQLQGLFLFFVFVFVFFAGGLDAGAVFLTVGVSALCCLATT